MVRDELIVSLKREKELELVVKGRKSGREIPRPVWFVLRGDDLLFLPVTGSSSQWYKNILKDPGVKITVAGKAYSGKVQPIKDSKGVAEVVELFKKKYGAGDIKRYYPKLNAATRLPLA